MNIDPIIYVKLLFCSAVAVFMSAAMYLAKRKTRFGKLNQTTQQIIIGILFGFVAVFGTEHGVDVGGAVANARDAAPLCAGLLFGAPAGIVAGLIGGVERWFAVAWGAGEYSRIACSVSTILAGFYAGFLRKLVFDNKRPSPLLGFITGGVMEIIHMTILFLTHLTDSDEAFRIVKICVQPMTFCNGMSVLLSISIVMLLSSGLHRSEKRYKNISQLFQFPILIAVVFAYLASTIFVYFLQTYSAKANAISLIELNINDVRQDILDASDKHIISITRNIAAELDDIHQGKSPAVPLKDLAEKYGVTDIWYVNNDGIIEEATDNNVGYDMSSDSDLPENERQSSKFLVLLSDDCDEYVQEYRSLAADSNVKRKLAGVSMPDGGFVQTGYDAECFQDEISKQVHDITKNRHIGETGHIIIVDRNMKIVSDLNGIDAKDIDSSDFVIDKNTKLDEEFDVTINGTDVLAMVSESEGYFIVAVLPESEAYNNRSSMFYINSFMEVLVFSALFIEIYLIIRKVVLNNLHKVNSGLSQIIDGDLSTTIDVNSSEEFASLSKDINSTVSTLKQYIDDASSRIDKELAFARSIQYSALPSVFPPFPDKKEFDIFASMDTAKEVGGDFYDFYMTDSKHLAILIADVSGKGIPAAMFMMTAKTMIKSLAESGLPVNEVFTRANEKLCEGNEADMFVTAWLGILDIETGIIDFVNAGHNPPLISHNGTFDYLKSKAGFVLAGMSSVMYKKQTLELNPGDKIYLYTDGVTEATNPDQKLYGEEHLKNFINENSSENVENTIRIIREDIDAFAENAEQFDDITMLMVEYHGKCGQMEFRDFPATDAVLENAMSFVTEKLESASVLPKTVMQISVAFEEMFVNVAHYAYPDKPGNVSVGVLISDKSILIQIKDTGVPFNPFAKENPDITLSAEERQIGGLGIFMTKKIMDEVNYEYKDGYNIVTMKKSI